jgi:hypothetical protein
MERFAFSWFLFIYLFPEALLAVIGNVLALYEVVPDNLKQFVLGTVSQVDKAKRLIYDCPGHPHYSTVSRSIEQTPAAYVRRQEEAAARERARDEERKTFEDKVLNFMVPRCTDSCLTVSISSFP